ncbi:hypothetical protein RvY_03563 [Ramazzottius varieornatus]|uniref:ADP-ribosylation factor-like protein 13B n=1 Tax=Ramazzottius varieornatus TaxID=947166 RepID=A0A1D1US81_RAMVA|nr:hypothetical protein RvY_03563 [Ramazzottius varieornatus]
MGNSVVVRRSLPYCCCPAVKISPAALVDEMVVIKTVQNGQQNHDGLTRPPSVAANTAVSINSIIPLTAAAAATASQVKLPLSDRNGVSVKPAEAVSTAPSAAYLNRASLSSPLLDRYSRDNCPICLLLIGLDNSGKTSFLQSMAQRYPNKAQGRTPPALDLSDPKPTMGFSKDEVQYKKHLLLLHDLGGAKNIRPIWKNYFSEAHGIVLVVDGSLPIDSPRWDELNKIFEDLTASEDSGLQSRPLLIFLNKKDVKPSIDLDQFRTKMDQLPNFMEEYSISSRTFPVCLREKQHIAGMSGRSQLCHKNIEEGLLWLVRHIEDHFPSLHMKVQADTRQQMQRDEYLRKERAARMKALREAQDAEDALAAEGSSSNVLGSSPFIPLEKHLQRVERRRSSLLSSTMPTEMPNSKKRHSVSIPLRSSSMPRDLHAPAVSNLSDEYPSSQVFLDEAVDGKLFHNQRKNGSVNGQKVDGDLISDDGRTPQPQRKLSRPPIYRRMSLPSSKF